MRCEEYQDALSARLDGEAIPPGLADEEVDAHVATCAVCTAFAAGTVAQHRALRVRTAEPVPDLTDAILAALPQRARPQPVREWARYALLAVALTQLVIALPSIVLGSDPGASIHVARELGSFDVALGVGLLWAAWRPRLALGLLPMVMALAGTMIATAAIDVARGRVPAVGEAHHVLDIAGLAFLWLLAHPARPRRSDDPAGHPHGVKRAAVALAGLVLVALTLVGGLAAPASAHAVLISTTPTDRSSIDAAPPEVTLEFSEGITTTLGGVRAYDDAGERVDEGDLHVEGSRIRLDLEDGLGDGAYIVTYRVISADSHPVSGAFAFTVGDATAASDDTIAGLLGEGDDRKWEILGAVARALSYGGALTAAGLGAFLVLAFDGGEEQDRLRRWLLRGTIVGAVGVLIALPFQAAEATGLGIGALFEKGVAGKVLGEGVGWETAVVLAGLIFLAVDEGRHRWPTLAAALASTAGFAIAGHTTTADPRWLVTVADAGHAAAGGVWLGSLIGLVVVLRNRRGERAAEAAPVVGRFSSMAAIALLVIAAGGFLVGWREVRALHALTSTTYGRLLIAKVAVVAVVSLIGAWNRFRLVPAIAKAPKRAGAMLARAARVEGGLLLAAVAVTAVLVNVTPARTAAGIGTIFSDTVPFGDGSVNVVVDPNRAGPNAIHLYVFDDAGRVTQQSFDDLKVELSLPAAQIGPLEREPYVAGPGHFQVDGSDLSIAGDWTIDVVGRVDEFTEVTAEVTVPVNP